MGPAGRLGVRDAQNVDINHALTRVTAIGAVGLTALSVIAFWGDWWRVGGMIGVFALGMTGGTFIAFVLLPKYGGRVEWTYAAVNIATLAVSTWMSAGAGWPVTTWFSQPFLALVLDQGRPKTVVVTLLISCAAQDAIGLFLGVPWMIPLAFTTFALLCSEFTRVRFDVIRKMLFESGEQRLLLASAHAATSQALDRLTAEVAVREGMELELRQGQKLEAVGRLAAGLAHEINTPMQFVSDNFSFIVDATRDGLPLLKQYRAFRIAVSAHENTDEMASVLAQAEETADLAYILENVPAAMESATEGLSRVAAIVHSMKEFSHPDIKEKAPADLNRALLSTLDIARHEYRLVADVETDLADIPLVSCHVGQLNQVFLNLIVNAAHAIGDSVRGTDARGTIRIATHADGDGVIVSFADTGGGIPEGLRSKIFEPFFTTKEVGRGTGQGLAIARNVVVDKHHGSLTFDSSLGVGSTFFVRLPIAC